MAVATVMMCNRLRRHPHRTAGGRGRGPWPVADGDGDDDGKFDGVRVLAPLGLAAALGTVSSDVTTRLDVGTATTPNGCDCAPREDGVGEGEVAGCCYGGDGVVWRSSRPSVRSIWALARPSPLGRPRSLGRNSRGDQRRCGGGIRNIPISPG